MIISNNQLADGVGSKSDCTFCAVLSESTPSAEDTINRNWEPKSELSKLK